MNSIVKAYNGHEMQFRDDGWFNATAAADRFGKDPSTWIRQAETVSYMCSLADRLGSNSDLRSEFNKINDLYVGTLNSGNARKALLALAKQTKMVLTKRGAPENGGGTWLHPKLAVAFARWLDDDFAVWCDLQIDSIIHGTNTKDWHKLRHEAASSFKVMSEVLQAARSADGKHTEPHHYMVESKLVNGVLTGKYEGLDREAMDVSTLDDLAKLEVHNSLLLARGIPYQRRKTELKKLMRPRNALSVIP